ncbi:hypothetical protein Tco_1086646 [Tanacetum coccineum]
MQFLGDRLVSWSSKRQKSVAISGTEAECVAMSGCSHDIESVNIISIMMNAHCRAVVRLPDPKLKTLGERGIECIFGGYVEHSKVFRFFVIEPNDSVAINSIIKSKDAIFDLNRFSSVPRPSLKIPNGTEDIGGSVVPE